MTFVKGVAALMAAGLMVSATASRAGPLPAAGSGIGAAIPTERVQYWHDDEDAYEPPRARTYRGYPRSDLDDDASPGFGYGRRHGWREQREIMKERLRAQKEALKEERHMQKEMLKEERRMQKEVLKEQARSWRRQQGWH